MAESQVEGRARQGSELSPLGCECQPGCAHIGVPGTAWVQRRLPRQRGRRVLVAGPVGLPWTDLRSTGAYPVPLSGGSTRTGPAIPGVWYGRRASVPGFPAFGDAAAAQDPNGPG